MTSSPGTDLAPKGPRRSSSSPVGPVARGPGTAVQRLTGWLQTQHVARIEIVTPSRGAGRSVWLRAGFRPYLETLVLGRE